MQLVGDIVRVLVAKTWIEDDERCTMERELLADANITEIRELEDIVTSAQHTGLFYPVDPGEPSFDITLFDDEGEEFDVSVAGDLIMYSREFEEAQPGRMAPLLSRLLSVCEVRREGVSEFLGAHSM